LVSDAISLALEKAMPSLSMLVVLLCDTDFVNGELIAKNDIPPWVSQGDSIAYYYQKRRDFLDRLYAAGPGKVHVFERTVSWMHSKAWVFDDKFAIIGSANVNRRGYTHDSEVQCGIFDVKADKKSRWYWAHELRMNLWAKHLGVSPISCRDPIASLPFWTATSTGTTRAVRVYDRNRDKATQTAGNGFHPDSTAWYKGIAWEKVVDPPATPLDKTAHVRFHGKIRLVDGLPRALSGKFTATESHASFSGERQLREVVDDIEISWEYGPAQ